MPGPKRQRVAPTDDSQQLWLLLEWPEQILYELIRSVVLFGRSAGGRAKETGAAVRTLHRKADRFDAHGMASLFAEFREPRQRERRMLPPPLRQLIVDRKTEYRAFTPHELATLCCVASGRRPSAHAVKRVLATGPTPTSISRRYPRFYRFTDRQDDRHSPAEVLGWVHGMHRDPAELHRIFYATRCGRTLDKLGYVRFRHWRIYGERGLARHRAAVWLYGETLLLEFSDELLAQYRVCYEPDRRHLRDVVPRDHSRHGRDQDDQREQGDRHVHT